MAEVAVVDPPAPSNYKNGRMFALYCELDDDGFPVFDASRPPPSFPPLDYPKDPVAGKGWKALSCPTETQQNQLSFNFLKAITESRWNTVAHALKFRINLELIGDGDKTALHLAIERRHEQLVRFLLQQAVDVDASDEEGFTALHLACLYDDLRLVRCLIFCGANVHRLTDEGMNALHICAVRGNTRIAKRLIKKGVDLTCKSKAGKTPADVAKAFEQPAMQAYLESEIEKQNQMIRDYMKKLQDEEDAKNKLAAAATRNTIDQYGFKSYPALTGSSHSVYKPTMYQGGASTPSSFRGDGLRCTGAGTFGDGSNSPPLYNTHASAKKLDDDDAEMFWGSMFEDDSKKKSGASPKRVRFQEDDNDCPDEWSSDAESQLDRQSTVDCVNCSSKQDKDRDYCFRCGYVLNEVCPDCYAIIDSPNVEDYCPTCFSSLWNEQYVADAAAAKRLISVQNFSNSGLMITCTACQHEEPASSKYCSGCGYVLLNMCPHCSAPQIKGHDDCPRCQGDLWDAGIHDRTSDELLALARSAQQATLIEQPRVNLTTQCGFCTVEQSVQNDYCEECNYALSDICPNCLHMPISLASTCPKCSQSLWNVPAHVPNLNEAETFKEDDAEAEVAPLFFEIPL